MTDLRPDPSRTPTVAGELRLERRWLLPFGVVLVSLGAMAVIAAFTATLATVFLFGALLLLGGFAQLGQALGSRSEDFGWELAGGALYVLAGMLLCLDPVSGAIGLTLLLALFFLLVGGLHLVLGLRLRRALASGGASFLVAGSLELLIGLLVVLGLPETGGWVIGLLLGLELLFAGVCALLLHRLVRRHPSLASS